MKKKKIMSTTLKSIYEENKKNPDFFIYKDIEDLLIVVDWKIEFFDDMEEEDAAAIIVGKSLKGGEVSLPLYNMKLALVKKFIRTYVYGRSRRPVPDTSTASPAVDTILDFNGKMVPELLQSFSNPTRCTPSVVWNALKEKKESNGGTIFDNVIKVDFSNNNLLDSDVGVLFAILKLMRSDATTTSTGENLVVDLSFNRFAGIDANSRPMLDVVLFGICNLSYVSHLILYGNPCASIDRKDLYREFYIKKILKKVIFIAPTVHSIVYDSILKPFLETLDDPDKESFKELVLDTVKDYEFPIMGELDFGHFTTNIPMPNGIKISFDTSKKELIFLESAVC